MILNIDRARIKEVARKFVWGKNKRTGYQVVLSAPFDNREEPDNKYSDLYTMVFRNDLMELIDANVGSEAQFSFKAKVSFRKVKSKKYVDKETQEPAMIPAWDFVLREGILVNLKDESKEEYPTLDDIFEE